MIAVDAVPVTYSPGWVTALVLFATPLLILASGPLERAWRRQQARHADYIAARSWASMSSALSTGHAVTPPPPGPRRDPSPIPRTTNNRPATDERAA